MRWTDEHCCGQRNIRKGKNAGIGALGPCLDSATPCRARPVWGLQMGREFRAAPPAPLHPLDFLTSSLSGLGLIAEDPFCSTILVAQLLIIMVVSLRLVIQVGILVELWQQMSG